jgi:tetratricopeptide repeat protein
MKRKFLLLFICLLSLLSCSQKKLPHYPATDDGITRMHLDSAAIYTKKHDLHKAMYQLKAAEKRLFNVTQDSLKFLTYYHIAQINAQDGAYKIALEYLKHAARNANDVKRSHRMTDIYIEKAFIYNQMGNRDSALNSLQRVEKYKPRIRKDQEKRIEEMRQHIKRHQIVAISPGKDVEIVQLQDLYEVALAQRKAVELKLYIAYLLLTLILVSIGITIWFRRRMRQQLQFYRQQQQETEHNIQLTLRRKDATIDEMKAEIDSKLDELNQLRYSIKAHNKNIKTSDSIEQIKLGIDTLYTILKGGNLSQMGKREQQALNMIMPNYDYELSYILNNPRFALTPKECFYYIMEHYGIEDELKAQAFCCTAQAIRSIKSRLKKKLEQN